MKLAALILVSALIVLALIALPSASPQIPSGRDVVSPAAYVSVEPVARNAPFQIAVVLKIRNGFHINAHQASADYLIPTTLRAEGPAGFQLGEVSYPKGELHTFSFTKTPLNVYQEKAILRLPVTVQPGAALGSQHLPLKLRYQACSQEVCLPPVTLDVDAAFTVAANAANSRPVHPELFAKP